MARQAYFAGGCFWCISPVFRSLPGVKGVESGYSGGAEADPAYEDVKKQRTGHRETVRLDYDEAETSFGRLMEVFLKNVDPFDGGGQFIDRGRSYTLAVYYTCEEERAEARRQLDALAQETEKTPQVALEPFSAFYRAEEYHQDYDLKNPEAFQKEIEESGRGRRKNEL